MRAFQVDAEQLEAMAADSGRSIEIGANTAYLSVNGTTWYAVLGSAA